MECLKNSKKYLREQNTCLNKNFFLNVLNVEESQFKKSTKKFEFWHHRPISCFDLDAQPIKRIKIGGQAFGRKIFLFRFGCMYFMEFHLEACAESTKLNWLSLLQLKWLNVHFSQWFTLGHFVRHCLIWGSGPKTNTT